MEQTTNSHSDLRDAKILTTLFIVITLLTKIVFYEEKISTILMTIAAFFWLLILPGYFLTKIWKEQNTTERFIISIPFSAALLGISSYYLGLSGLGLSTQALILPPAIILFSILVNKIFKDTT